VAYLHGAASVLLVVIRDRLWASHSQACDSYKDVARAAGGG
jgi:hypothetical protein